jgi:hypothetical protein
MGVTFTIKELSNHYWANSHTEASVISKSPLSLDRYAEFLPDLGPRLVLKLRHPPRLEEAGFKSQTPVVIQRH